MSRTRNIDTSSKNLHFAVFCSLGIVVGIGTTFAAGGPTNLWEFRKHIEEGGAFTITAVMLDIKQPPVDYNPNAPGGLDDHGYGLDRTAPAKLVFNSGEGPSNGMKFTAGYYRGPIYSFSGRGIPVATPAADGTNYVSIFSKADRSELIAAVDYGPIYRSTNSGMTWKAITAPGVYEFPISVTSGARGLYAQVTIASSNAPVSNWYAIASSDDGSKLVVTANMSQPSPTLNIRYANAGITIVWPAEFTGFTLEHNTDLTGEAWTAVTNSPQVIGGENRVTIPSISGSDFFRLRRPQ